MKATMSDELIGSEDLSAEMWAVLLLHEYGYYRAIKHVQELIVEGARMGGDYTSAFWTQVQHEILYEQSETRNGMGSDVE